MDIILFIILNFIVTVGCPVVGSTKLLFTTQRDIREFDTVNPKTSLSMVVDSLTEIAFVDFLYSEEMIFWADIIEKKIYRLVTNHSGNVIQPIITTGISSPEGLACDWIGRHIYWADSDTKRIEVCDIDGNNRKVLYWKDIDQPRSIAIDPAVGYMFWSDWGQVPKIERAGMDGSADSRSTIIHRNIHWPNGLTLDYGQSRIYWVDAKLSYIHSCDYFGKERVKVTEGLEGHPFSLTFHEDILYWTDWQTENIRSYHTGNGEKGIVLDRINDVRGIQAYMPSRQAPALNPCEVEASGCSHLCLLSPAEPYYKCACPTGVKLRPDGKNCFDGPRDILFFARRKDLRQVSLDTPDYTDVIIPVNVNTSIAVDVDPVDGYIYWTDKDESTAGIGRCRLDGSGQETIISSGIFHPGGLAVDWMAGNLYWTDTGTDTLEVARLNGTSRKTLISDGLDEPRAICLDPQRGFMFWTDWGRNPKIDRTYLDGSHRITIIASGLGWPNGLACDIDEQRLIWADAKTDKIEVVNMDGTERKVLIDEHLPHVFGLSILGDSIYWSDWQTRSIEAADKRTGKNRTVLVTQLPDLMSLKAAKSSGYGGSNACSSNNGGCSHLCLFTPEGPKCACPDGLILSSTDSVCREPGAFLLLSNGTDVMNMSLDDVSRISNLGTTDPDKFYDIDCDVRNNVLYWIPGNRRMIRRSHLNGTAMETIIQSNDLSLQDLAVDWLANNIYWIDAARNRIEMARTNGSSRLIIVWKNLTDPLCLVLDPPNGYMYWAAASGPDFYHIERALLDGKERSGIVSDLGLVTALTVDAEAGDLYWADVYNEIIGTSKRNGNNRRTLIQNGISTVTALSQHQGYLYWSDYDHLTVEKAYKTSGENRSIIQEDLCSIVDMMVVHASKQPGLNVCHRNNGGCAHLCIALPSNKETTHTCACPTHYALGSDNSTCSAPRSFLLISQHKSLRRLDVNVTDPTDILDVVLPTPSLGYVRAIEFDRWNNVLYWIDSRRIKQVKVDSTGIKQLSKSVGNDAISRPFDLVHDPYSRILFWSCMKRNVISFSGADIFGHVQRKGTVVKEGKPRYLAINPEQGEIFWTSSDEPPSIHKSKYDGKYLVTFVSTGLVKAGPILVDTTANQLFWSDLQRNIIEASDLTGENRRMVFKSDFIAGLVSMATMYNDLYLINRKTIRRVDKDTGANDTKVVKHGYRRLKDILAFSDLNETKLRDHPCSKQNGGCSHLCMVTPGNDVLCGCPGKMVLKRDRRTCAERQACSPGHFQCTSGDIVCIPEVWRCDGVAECLDGSDEENCNDGSDEERCNATQYSGDFCKDGQLQADCFMCNHNNDVCIPCRNASILEYYCYADIVLKTMVTSVNYIINGARRLKFRKKTLIMKGEKKHLTIFGDPTIAPDSVCGCDAALNLDGKMLIFVVTRKYISYVVYMARITDDQKFKQNIKRINNGYDCSQYVNVPELPVMIGGDIETETESTTLCSEIKYRTRDPDARNATFCKDLGNGTLNHDDKNETQNSKDEDGSFNTKDTKGNFNSKDTDGTLNAMKIHLTHNIKDKKVTIGCSEHANAVSSNKTLSSGTGNQTVGPETEN